ncbi:MAG: response regulator transcription factor, partial [Oscillospiraceae bacterium]
MNNKYTVLIVEDDQGIANCISAILTANEYAVLRASSAADAQMMINSHCPDIILLDLGLPDGDGRDVLKSVRKWSQTPVIVVSARTHERDKVSALDLGADDYVTKPFGTSELLARVRTALRHTRNRDATDTVAQTGKFAAGKLTVDLDKRRVS